MDVFLARQPIFDAKQNVYAYEILYRNGYTNSFPGIEADEASSKVILDTFHTFGLTNITHGKPAFINFSGNLIEKEIATLFPSSSLVVEILETVIPDEKVIEKCKFLKSRGYTIALDDFVYRPGYELLIELADIIKIDYINSDRAAVEQNVMMLRNRNIKLLAEKIETRHDFEYTKSLGFSLFQGFFFSRPEILTTSSLSPLKINSIRLMSRANQAVIDFDELAGIISQDLSLTYNLLKLINSAAFALRREVSSVKQALVILGEKEIRKWVTLVALHGMGQDKPAEIVRLSLLRARFAELISLKTKLRSRSDDLFLMGIFSLLDVILSKPLSDILSEINAPKGVREALLSDGGEFAVIYEIIRSYEKAEWDDIKRHSESLQIDYREVISDYLNALLWYNKIMQA